MINKACLTHWSWPVGAMQQYLLFEQYLLFLGAIVMKVPSQNFTVTCSSEQVLTTDGDFTHNLSLSSFPFF